MDHTENTLRGIVKTMTDVIAPALDPTDALAAEQLRLSVDYLNFVRARLDVLYGREVFDLRHHLAMARALGALAPPCSPDTASRLATAIQGGEAAAAEPGAGVPVLKAATLALAAAIRILVREAAGFEEGARMGVETAVLDHTDERIAFERAWYLPLGFEPAPAEVEPVATILDRNPGLRPSRRSP